MTRQYTEMSNEHLVEQYIDWMDRSRKRQATSMRAYRRAVEGFARYTGENLTRATIPDMETYVTRPKKNGETRAPATISQEVHILRAFYQWLWEQGWTPEHLARALHGPKLTHKDPKPISDTDWRQIWIQDRLSPSERTILGLAYFCGLRRYELWNLRTGQLGERAVERFVRKGGGEHTLRWDQVLDVYERSDTLAPLLLDRSMFLDAVGKVRDGRDRWLAPCHRSGNINQFNRWWTRLMPDGVSTDTPIRPATPAPQIWYGRGYPTRWS